MSWFEITLIILVCLSPIVALVLISFSKFKKKEKQNPAIEQTPIKEEPKPNKDEITKQNKKVEADVEHAVFNSDGFKEYLNERSGKTVKPQHLSMENNMKFPTSMYNREDFEQMMRPMQKNKTISEQIKTLSPELKALMIAGVFNKKDYE